MELTFWSTDQEFEQNIHALRMAEIRKRPHAPRFLVILIDGTAVDATTAHVRPDGWFAYTDDAGERRIERERVAWVKAFYR